MGKQKPSSSGHGPRRTYNNNNPHNKLNLNKFHQIGAKTHNTESHQLHKKKRDLQRLIEYKKSKNQEVDATKLEQLQKLNEELGGKKKEYEKNMRKQFFIKNKYKQIMEIQMRKIVKRIRALQEQPKTQQNKKQLQEWLKKQRYIKFFPKNLKYVSLFPSTKPLQDGAKQFQQKIMDDIQQTYLKKVRQRNEYVSENKIVEKNNKSQNIGVPSKDKKKKDNFFLVEEEEEEEEQMQD